jgi:hypothetical protein
MTIITFTALRVQSNAESTQEWPITGTQCQKHSDTTQNDTGYITNTENTNYATTDVHVTFDQV